MITPECLRPEFDGSQALTRLAPSSSGHGLLANSCLKGILVLVMQSERMSTCLLRTILRIKAPRRGLVEITPQVQRALPPGAKSFVHLFLRHTSASLLVQENADPSARHDLELFFERLIPLGGQPGFRHLVEGPDDMPSHIKTALTQTSLWIPADQQGLMLGTWQGVYLWEHRESCPQREIVLSVTH